MDSSKEGFLRKLNDSIMPFKGKLEGMRDQLTVDANGWMQADVTRVFDIVDFSKIERPLLIEVGTWKGKSAITFAKRLREYDGRIMCIDTWLGSPEFWTWGIEMDDRGKALARNFGYPSVYYVFLRNVFLEGIEHIVHPFPISAEQALVVLKYYEVDADAIYVDASHEEGSVRRDIEGYWGILKPGGVIFGDDYCVEWPGVVHDVNAFCQDNKLVARLAGVVWFIVKPLVTLDL